MRYLQADIVNKDGIIEGIASTSVVDRQNESVNVDGWDLKNFKKAPRLLWAHDHTEPAIGKVTKIGVEGEGKKRALKFSAVMQDITDKGKAIKALLEQGFLNSFSVGFRPLEAEGDAITKQELLEISVVNVPANPEALLLAVKSLNEQGFSHEVIKDVLENPKYLLKDEDIPDSSEENALDARYEAQKQQIDEQIAAFDQRLTKVEEKAELAVKGLKHLNPQRSKPEIAATRLSALKVIARTSDKLLAENKGSDAVLSLKVIKRSSEILSRSLKGDL